MCEKCKSENAIECSALHLGLTFYQCMGFGYECNCDCHVHSDEQTVANFQRFMRECNEAGVHPNIVGGEVHDYSNEEIHRGR